MHSRQVTLGDTQSLPTEDSEGLNQGQLRRDSALFCTVDARDSEGGLRENYLLCCRWRPRGRAH